MVLVTRHSSEEELSFKQPLKVFVCQLHSVDFASYTASGYSRLILFRLMHIVLNKKIQSVLLFNITSIIFKFIKVEL